VPKPASRDIKQTLVATDTTYTSAAWLYRRLFRVLFRKKWEDGVLDLPV